MKRTIIISSIFVIFFFSYLFTPVFAWGPTTHCGIIAGVRISPELLSAQAKMLMNTYDRYFWEGVMFPDITVLAYYTSMKKYSSTHEWDFYSKIWTAADQTLKSDEARAFALGVGTHLIQDAMVHNSYVPAKIKQYLVQNIILHPLVEANIEGKYMTEGDPWFVPEAVPRAKTAFLSVEMNFNNASVFSYINGPDKRPMDFAIQYGLGFQPAGILGSDGIDYNDYINSTLTMKTFLGTANFYSQGFTISSQLWGLYQAVGGIIKYFVDVNDAKKYIDLTVDATVDWYNHDGINGENWRSTPEKCVSGQLSPSGLAALDGANSYVATWFYVIVFIGVVGFGGVYFFYKRSKKNLPLPMLGSL